jgi:molybdenum cofactor synthesis domain-containing protein
VRSPACGLPPAAYAAAVARPAETVGTAVVIAVGDELLSGFTLDTNSNLLARALFAVGQPVRRIEVVADDREAIAVSVRRAVGEPGVSYIVVSGGIGPTPDDVTFDAVAYALGRAVVLHPGAFAHIQTLVQRMHDAGWVDSGEVSPANRRSAMLPDGAQLIPNRRGMAPAIRVGLDDRDLFVLPGIPREFATIVEEELIPHHIGRGRAQAVIEVRYAAVPEAEMAAPMQQIAAEFPDVVIGSYPQTQRRELVMRLRGIDAGRVAAAAERLRQLRRDD